jgi:hypothetical protein
MTSKESFPSQLIQRTEMDDEAWIAGRKVVGEMHLKYGVLVQQNLSYGGITLRRDQGGLLGPGRTFIPIPRNDQVHGNIVKWNLAQAPAGTRAVWTFGEGPNAVEKVGPAAMIADSVYMVGPIQSFPVMPVVGNISDYYGYYWFKTLPSNIEVIQKIHHDFFLKIAGFFDDPPTQENPYRSFVCNTGHTGNFGGTFYTRSHIFDYDDRIEQTEDYSLVWRMAYEMSHNWLGPRSTGKEIDWFYEGLKNCLSIYFPYRNGFRTDHYFQWTISMLCTRQLKI